LTVRSTATGLRLSGLITFQTHTFAHQSGTGNHESCPELIVTGLRNAAKAARPPVRSGCHPDNRASSVRPVSLMIHERSLLHLCVPKISYTALISTRLGTCHRNRQARAMTASNHPLQQTACDGTTSPRSERVTDGNPGGGTADEPSVRPSRKTKRSGDLRPPHGRLVNARIHLGRVCRRARIQVADCYESGPRRRGVRINVLTFPPLPSVPAPGYG
jgi:hypothetical protein